MDAQAWTGVIPFLWHRPLWPGPVWLSSCRSCGLFHLLVPFLVLMGPNNQDFQGYSIHGAPWTTTWTIYFTVQPPFSHSLVSPCPTGSGSPIQFLLHTLTLLRSCPPSLSVLGFLGATALAVLGWEAILRCAAWSLLHCTTFLTSGSWALNAGRSPLLLRQPPNPHNIFANLPTFV